MGELRLHFFFTASMAWSTLSFSFAERRGERRSCSCGFLPPFGEAGVAAAAAAIVCFW
jgi:hypothetical protein